MLLDSARSDVLLCRGGIEEEQGEERGIIREGMHGGGKKVGTSHWEGRRRYGG